MNIGTGALIGAAVAAVLGGGLLVTAFGPGDAPERVASVSELTWEDLLPEGHNPYADVQDLEMPADMEMPEGLEAIPEDEIPTGDEPTADGDTPADTPADTDAVARIDETGSTDGSDEGWSSVAEVPLDARAPGPSTTITDMVDGEPPIDRFNTVPGLPGLDEDYTGRPTFAPKMSAPPAPVRPELDGRTVAIGGYMTPLTMEGDRVRSFLLVPYVGACIHVPPPPANQIVLVELPEGATVALKDMWEPFTAVGTLRTQTRQTDLADVGYTMTLARIDPYVDEPVEVN